MKKLNSVESNSFHQHFLLLAIFFLGSCGRTGPGREPHTAWLGGGKKSQKTSSRVKLFSSMLCQKRISLGLVSAGRQLCHRS